MLKIVDDLIVLHSILTNPVLLLATTILQEGEGKTDNQKQLAQEKIRDKSQVQSIFSKEIIWRPISSKESFTYDQSCPAGGPGGLICCEICSTKYNTFLTATSEDVETHRILKESGEVTEILEFLGQKKDILKEAIKTAKTKVPPLPPPGSGRLTLRQEPHSFSRSSIGDRKPGTTSRSENSVINPGAWNMTSSIDVGVVGGFASV